MTMQNEKQSTHTILWIIISMVIFLVVEVVLGGFIGPLISGRFLSHPFFIRLELILMLASYFFGGLIVGLISPSVRILEPAIGAALAVVFTFAYSFFTPLRFYGFSCDRALIGAIIAFLLALAGADIGERIAARLGNRASQDYIERKKE
jgi:hypothetical protein